MPSLPPSYPAPSSAVLRARLEAQTRALQQHSDALRSELTTVSDVTVGGRPLLDHVRAQPLLAAGLTLATGLILGLATGARSRKHDERDERTEVLRVYAARLLDDAAERVARGTDAESAVDQAIDKRPPLIYYAPPERGPRSTLAETFDVGIKTALGFAIKMGLDRLAQQITGEDELFEAVEKVEQDPYV